ncbi:hypothetical protein [Brevibacillus daliensis]|uniref:hypothetical protein n=1 Tax=Brevibacillus daliensis TaxID=2892995 RepID=UPI001E2C6C1F|nr:hypothetical protein [Brevibacillus daliensis]
MKIIQIIHLLLLAMPMVAFFFQLAGIITVTEFWIIAGVIVIIGVINQLVKMKVEGKL